MHRSAQDGILCLMAEGFIKTHLCKRGGREQMSISTLKAGVKPRINLICHLWPALTQCSVNKLYGRIGCNTPAVHLKTWTAIIRKWEKEGFLSKFYLSFQMANEWKVILDVQANHMCSISSNISI